MPYILSQQVVFDFSLEYFIPWVDTQHCFTPYVDTTIVKVYYFSALYICTNICLCKG